MRNVKSAMNMFAEAQLAGGFGQVLDLQNAVNTDYMFHKCESSDFPFGRSVSLPNAETAQYMFSEMKVGAGQVALDSVSAPKCKFAKYMFSATKWLTGVRSVEIGENAQGTAEEQGATGMFMNCQALKIVGNISMPTALTAWGMFFDCSALERVGVVNMPRVTVMDRMFANCDHLLNVCQFFVPSTASSDDMFGGTQLGKRAYGPDGRVVLARMRAMGR